MNMKMLQVDFDYGVKKYYSQSLTATINSNLENLSGYAGSTLGVVNGDLNIKLYFKTSSNLFKRTVDPKIARIAKIDNSYVADESLQEMLAGNFILPNEELDVEVVRRDKLEILTVEINPYLTISNILQFDKDEYKIGLKSFKRHGNKQFELEFMFIKLNKAEKRALEARKAKMASMNKGNNTNSEKPKNNNNNSQKQSQSNKNVTMI